MNYGMCILRLRIQLRSSGAHIRGVAQIMAALSENMIWMNTTRVIDMFSNLHCSIRFNFSDLSSYPQRYYYDLIPLDNKLLL